MKEKMDVFKAIEARHSYRSGFSPTPVPRKDLERIVRAGIQAPSGYNAQTTSFVIVDEPALIKEMARIAENDVIAAAPAAVVCVMDPRETEPGRLRCGVEDYSAAVENMLLAVTALGYASVWIDGILREEERAARIGALLSVPRRQVVRAILPIGKPTEQGKQAEKKPFGERAWFNRFGG
ncbi:MAG: nitroreductase family protein [Spirochaetia bacterium]|jgi:nitroreductase